jgi:thiamine pyrophosphokinase
VNALLVGAAPAPESPALVAQLATSADLVVAVDGGGATCLSAGVMPDALIGDLDSIDKTTLRRLTDVGVRVVRFPAEKDETDLELAIAWVRAAGAKTVTVTAASRERLDHTLAAIGAIASAADLQPRLAEPDCDMWVLTPSARSRLTVSGVGRTVTLMAWGGDAVVTVVGAKWPLARDRLTAGSGHGLGNVVTAETGLVVEAHGGCVLVLALSPHVGLRSA